MLETPTCYTLAVGAAEGETELNAFDNALLQAGIGNVNLVKVSSILPPKAAFCPEVALPTGALVPTAYASISGSTPGERLAAAVGVGLSRDGFGVIMEFHGHCGKGEAEQRVEEMLQAAFAQRRMPLMEMRIRAVEHTVGRLGAVVAAVVLWYDGVSEGRP
ncbi:MAG: arginine decarboxylase, pyruvoyl-dependent [candidate division NC10 bacterium]|nr:arginine decarboxylase, pyruvoyl-dependent [candidate division NC10 bacterium]